MNSTIKVKYFIENLNTAMGRKNSYLTITDQFCGAGGSSQGARRLSQKIGGGLEVKLAMNQWRFAIETHNTNFPDTEHDCADIQAIDSSRKIFAICRI